LLPANGMRAGSVSLLVLALALPGACGVVPVELPEAGPASAVPPPGGPASPGAASPRPPIDVADADAGLPPAVGAPAPPDAGAATADAAGRPADTTAPRDSAAPPDATVPRPMADAARPPDATAPRDAPPPPEVPAGCQVVTCGGVVGDRGCCRAWFSFALESEDRGQVPRAALVTRYEEGDEVRASYTFDRIGQDGAVGMSLDRPRRLAAVRVISESGGPAGGRPFITAESDASGCGYPLLPGGPADLDRPLFCWGDQALLPDRITIRIEAIASGPASIRVIGLEVR
jgi:hypothetical protein